MTIFREKLRRLGEMSAGELYFRMVQGFRVARERWQVSRNGARARRSDWWRYWDMNRICDSNLKEMVQAGEYAEVSRHLPAYFSKGKRPSFFFSLEERKQICRLYGQSFGYRIDQLRVEADAICDHRLQIFAYPEIACGRRIPWRRDLIHGTESNLEHRSHVLYLDFEKVGDSKIVWEPNRHQHLVTLAQAYAITGEERYAEECMEQWEDWQHQNPFARGINWASSLEAAFRVWSWLWVLHLLLGSRALDGERLARLTEGFAEHADFIAANLSAYFSPNTHLLGEGFTLFILGLQLPELCGARDWLETGRRILVEQVQRQTREDGSQLEQSSYYHRYATDFLLCAAILADRAGLPFPEDYLKRLQRMVEFMIHTALPGGRDPMTGDADGGRVLSLAPRDPIDYRRTFSTAAVYFRRGDFRSAAGAFSEETLWLMGPEALRLFDQLESAEPHSRSRVFPDAGVLIIRDGIRESSRTLLFDAGPQGMGLCAHGHADALSIICSADGVDWLVDPGTCVYTSSRDWRDFFRSTRAHNTVVVDGRNQAEAVDCFKWRNVPDVRLERWTLLPSLVFAVGSHNGYARTKRPVLHRRFVTFVRPNYWIVTDELSGRGEHDFDFFFHFSPGVGLRRVDGGWLATKDGSTFLVVPPESGVDTFIESGNESPIQGWYSKDYGHRVPAPVLIGHARASAPGIFHWLLYPGISGGVRVQGSVPSEPYLVIETNVGTDFFAWGGLTKQDVRGPLRTDAELALVRRDRDGQFRRLAMVNGSYMEACKQALVHSHARVHEFDMSCDAGTIDVWIRPAREFRVYCPQAVRARVNGRGKLFRRDNDWIEVSGED